MTGLFAKKVELSIIEALKRGDKRAQQIVYELLSPVVFTMVKRILDDQHSAEEVTQDTFVDVIKRSATLKNPDAFNGWVRTIALNHCFMRLRSLWIKRRENIENCTDWVGFVAEVYGSKRYFDKVFSNSFKALCREESVCWNRCLFINRHSCVHTIWPA